MNALPVIGSYSRTSLVAIAHKSIPARRLLIALLNIALLHGGCSAPQSVRQSAPVSRPQPTAQALRDAAIEGRADEVQRILNQDPKLVDVPDPEGNTALIIAAGRHGRPFAIEFSQHSRCVQLLLEFGADVKAVNASGITPLLAVASFPLFPRTARVMLNGEPFARILDRVQVQSMQYILAKQPNLNAVDRFGRTALYYTALAGRTEMARLLLASGADKSIRTNDGATALDVAKRQGHDSVVALLDR